MQIGSRYLEKGKCVWTTEKSFLVPRKLCWRIAPGRFPSGKKTVEWYLHYLFSLCSSHCPPCSHPSDLVNIYMCTYMFCVSPLEHGWNYILCFSILLPKDLYHCITMMFKYIFEQWAVSLHRIQHSTVFSGIVYSVTEKQQLHRMLLIVQEETIAK